MILLDYNKGIHYKSGKQYDVIDDIIVTPFWTEEFCTNLIQIADFYSEYFRKEIAFKDKTDRYLGWHDLNLEHVSPIFFHEYTRHYKHHLTPILEQVFGVSPKQNFKDHTSFSFGHVTGWFSPFIIKYDQIGQSSSAHNDFSQFTLNIKLNNNYSGSELYFPRQNFSNKDIPVGHAVIWPSTVSHPHLATPLEHGTKYSFISWTWPPNWQKSGIENL